MIKRVFLLLDLILFFQMVLYEKMNSAQTIMGNDSFIEHTEVSQNAQQHCGREAP